MMKRRNHGRPAWQALLLTLLLGFGYGAQAQQAEEDQDVGRIEVLDFERGTVQIDGYRYWTGPDLQVEINDSYGAFTMLRPGMYVEMRFRIKPGGQRELFRMTEVMDPRLHEDS